MALVANIGNTNISLGLCRSGEIKESCRLPVDDFLRIKEFPSWVREATEGAAVAGVNPKMQEQVCASLESEFELVIRLVVRESIQLTNLCWPPDTVGMDRLLNALAAHHLFPVDNVVVVDFGTAMSFSVVSGIGEFLGGAISPGLNMSARALHNQTAALPEVAPQKVDSAIGSDTVSAIRSGLQWGCAGALDRILDNLLKELPDAIILGTGGDLNWFLEHTEHAINPQPNLTLMGIAHAAGLAG
ncbi:MAG: type III pantothenate kinase [Planctomycetota bacterium]|nr:type III pantothenate kinase [Planctomycetota bacterium]MDA1139457.1 type III pantothenate kinase [Planctomycetota bacterium]